MDVMAAVRRRLRSRRCDAILITQPENRRYLSGYAAGDSSIVESSGALLIPSRGTPFLLTDFRFLLQARAEAPGFEVALYQKGLFALLEQLLPCLGVRSLAFESHYFLHSSYLKFEKMCARGGILPVGTTGLVEELRRRKTEAELGLIRRSVALNEAVFQEVFSELAVGKSERQVAIEIENAMRRLGAEGPSFETIVAAGPNAAMPHAKPSDRPIQEGEPIIIDMGAKLDGYCSDMTRTVVLGTPDEMTVGLIRLVRQAQQEAIIAIRAGASCRQVDGVARRVIANAGYGKYFGHGLGHGVGLAVHEAPSLSRRAGGKTLQAGMVVTVEPGIYLEGWGGVRLENMAVVRDDRAEILNRDTTFLDI
jgi:Xaa-Pro aminopeptidase